MILKIKSLNDQLLDILNRNPDTDFGLYLCPLKNGYIAGNAVSRHEYEVVFQDTKYSYSLDESNAIDYQSYCSPLAVLHSCNELFSHILKSRSDFAEKTIKWLGIKQGEADTVPCTIEITSFFIDSNWFRNGRFLLSVYFHEIETTQQSQQIFNLKITGKTVFEAFNILSLTALFTHVSNDYSLYVYLDDALVEKYGRILTNIENVPYFVFYLFTLKAVKSFNQFNILKPVFENYLATQGLQANLVLESTHRLRLLFILNLLEMDVSILDIGCGELAYYKKMMEKGFLAYYYAVDKDTDMERIAEAVSRRYEADNLAFFTSLDEFSTSDRLNILLTEVIEHNSFEEAKALIYKVLSLNFNKLIITTPNVEFNQFYSMERNLRHDDHCFELTRNEFQALINECVGETRHVEYFYLGDNLNGIQPVQGCIVT
ncbi:MAG: class I SAM-dependent methyltransferase [Bacteroidales bacterium]|jgi:hypothetical protein|nr:class I SAM-dependent methyltransferase [Bacteroidales bacterium]